VYTISASATAAHEKKKKKMLSGKKDKMLSVCQYVAVCCIVLQCVTVRRSALQHLVVCFSVL